MRAVGDAVTGSMLNLQVLDLESPRQMRDLYADIETNKNSEFVVDPGNADNIEPDGMQVV